eukprot:TRINITY_DN22643_c0_g2_i1.p1 TRINITY_DN22643_c0_g2~~TRINITY_DN22643_c0_g2_i1.p1  ORF type:complete len:136 (+),score=18.26 TRINITY_DN22643_c0_g2_i1:54-410(+)
MQGYLAIAVLLVPLACAYPSADLSGLAFGRGEGVAGHYSLPGLNFNRQRRAPYHYPGFYFSSMLKPNSYEQVKRDADIGASPYLGEFGGMPEGKGEGGDDYEAKKKLWEMFNIYNRYS